MPKVRGAKPHQPELRLLTGSTARTPRRTPTPAQRPPTAPSWLSVGQRAIWQRTIAELDAADIGALAIDQDLLTSYVVAVSNMETSAEIIAAEGPVVRGANGGKVRHPAVIVFGASARLVDSLAASLGLSPDSRTRMRLPVPDNEAQQIRDLYA